MSNNLDQYVEYDSTDDEGGSFITLHFKIPPNGIPVHESKGGIYDLVKNEVILDRYFQIKPSCTIDKGFWSKCRTLYENTTEQPKRTYIFEKVRKDNHSTTRTFNSNSALVEFIMESTEPEKTNILLQQDFFAETIIHRIILRHKSYPNTELHICSLKLDNTNNIFYNYGKLKIGSLKEEKEGKELLQLLLVELNLIELDYLIPANSPIIQKLMYDNSEVSSEEFYMFKKGTISDKPFEFKSAAFNEGLLSFFQYDILYME